jgi:hypothetical protein
MESINYKNLNDYEHSAGCIHVALKIRREYIHVALMTASLLSTILKTTWIQPMLLATSVLLILEKSVGHGFCVQISSQNREAIVPHQIGNS